MNTRNGKVSILIDCVLKDIIFFWEGGFVRKGRNGAVYGTGPDCSSKYFSINIKAVVSNEKSVQL